jgi:hypothetical protein
MVYPPPLGLGGPQQAYPAMYQHQHPGLLPPPPSHPLAPREPRQPRSSPYQGPPRDPALQAAISCNKRITAASRAEEIFAIVEQVGSLPRAQPGWPFDRHSDQPAAFRAMCA